MPAHRGRRVPLGRGDELGRQLLKDPTIALLRAQAALGEEEWGRAKTLLSPHARGDQASLVAPLLAQAEARLAEAKQEQAQQKELEQRLSQAEVRALDRAAAAARPSPGGVPVLDARGRLLTGFDERAYAEALQ